ncbi:MAG: ABC transporter ATP-binding protein, partial [Rhodospirillales bacterium]|nr:ABC transporter ATP-binding protein [Rhodospirillales bacterium]
KDLQGRFGMALVLIAHDLAVVKHAADRVAVMYLGRIVEIAGKDRLYGQPRHPYTQALLSAIPVPDPSVARARTLLEGDVPSPIDPPPGCHFHTRCAFAKDRCRAESPALEPVAAGHSVACHFWRDIPAFATLAAPPATNAQARLERLQARFVERSPVS